MNPSIFFIPAVLDAIASTPCEFPAPCELPAPWGTIAPFETVALDEFIATCEFNALGEFIAPCEEEAVTKSSVDKITPPIRLMSFIFRVGDSWLMPS
jgi:hypothetical protein